jgi:ubiquinol-cytochrome c reductase iron-sulfur subunit
MAALSTSTRALLRAARAPSTCVRALSTSAVQQDAASSSFESPFAKVRSDKIPDFSHYRSKAGSSNNLLFQYFMVGTMGALTAAGAKATVQGTLRIAGWKMDGMSWEGGGGPVGDQLIERDRHGA